jgi:hypothetical protein
MSKVVNENLPVYIKAGVVAVKESFNDFLVEGASKVFTMKFPRVNAKSLHPYDLIINENGEVYEVDAIFINENTYEVYLKNQNGNELIEKFSPDTVMGLVDNIQEVSINDSDEILELYEDEKKKVKLNKIMHGDVKKYKVYVKNDKGNVVKVNFGDPNMEIKRDNPARRKNFRARHHCDNPGPRWKAQYWACKTWSKTPVSKMLKEDTNPTIKHKKSVDCFVQDTLKTLNEHTYNPNLYGLMDKKNDK